MTLKLLSFRRQLTKNFNILMNGFEVNWLNIFSNLNVTKKNLIKWENKKVFWKLELMIWFNYSNKFDIFVQCSYIPFKERPFTLHQNHPIDFINYVSSVVIDTSKKSTKSKLRIVNSHENFCKKQKALWLKFV